MVIFYAIAQIFLLYSTVNAIPCSQVKHNLTDFNPEDFKGIWYIGAQLKNDGVVPPKCVKFGVMIRPDGIDQHIIETPAGSDQSSSHDWNLQFLGNPQNGFFKDLPEANRPQFYYQTLAIDKDKYEICLSCDTENDKLNIWVNLRQPQCTQEVKDAVLQVLNDNEFGLTCDDFDIIDNSCYKETRHQKKSRNNHKKSRKL